MILCTPVFSCLRKKHPKGEKREEGTRLDRIDVENDGCFLRSGFVQLDDAQSTMLHQISSNTNCWIIGEQKYQSVRWNQQVEKEVGGE